MKGAAHRAERARKGASSRTRRVTVELTEDELARLRVVCQERSRAAGRPVSQGEALRLAFYENFLDTRPPGESPATPEERRTIREEAEAAAVKASSAHVPVAVKRELRVANPEDPVWHWQLLPVGETSEGTPQDLGFRSARQRARAGEEVHAREAGQAA